MRGRPWIAYQETKPPWISAPSKPSSGGAGEEEKGGTSGRIIPSIGRKPAGALRGESRAREAAAGDAGIWGGESGREGERKVYGKNTAAV
jgi:hypothetical protein